MVQLFKGSNRRESTVVRDLNLLAGCRRARRLLTIAQRLTGAPTDATAKAAAEPSFLYGRARRAADLARHSRQIRELSCLI